jgi:hypothetical protein
MVERILGVHLELATPTARQLRVEVRSSGGRREAARRAVVGALLKQPCFQCFNALFQFFLPFFSPISVQIHEKLQK